jgi:hypothetical protein
MNFLSLEPFVPSGRQFDLAKQFFMEIGFQISWDAGEYVGFERGQCKFILQNFDDNEFAQNLMINIKIDNVEEFWRFVVESRLPERFGIKITEPKQQPYGREVNLIDMAGVCWHFVQ